MSKMQIIAKTALSVLGIYVVVMLCRYLSLVVPLLHVPIRLIGILYLAGLIVFIFLIAYSLILKNDRLACKMAGPAEPLCPVTHAIWLAASLRLATVFCGLVLLSTSIDPLVHILLWLWPSNIRQGVINIIEFKRFTPDLSPREWFTNIYNFIKALLAIYLLCGAPHFTRWQLKHRTIAPNQNLEKQKLKPTQI